MSNFSYFFLFLKTLCFYFNFSAKTDLSILLLQLINTYWYGFFGFIMSTIFFLCYFMIVPFVFLLGKIFFKKKKNRFLLLSVLRMKASITTQQYVNFIALFFGFFSVQLMIDANYFFGPKAALGMSYFNGSQFDARTQMFARFAGLNGLAISSMHHVFGVNAQKYAQLTLVLKVAMMPLFVFAALKIKDATIWWSFQIMMGLVITFVNFVVVDMDNFMGKIKSM